MSFSSKSTPRGVCTVVYRAVDHDAAKAWYAELLGVKPYLERPEYAEFRIGDYQHELGVLNERFAGHVGGTSDDATPGGVITYWHVDDVEAAFERLKSMGAKEFHPPRNFGRDFIGAAVVDPFGNVVGVMQNPHYIDMLKARPLAA